MLEAGENRGLTAGTIPVGLQYASADEAGWNSPLPDIAEGCVMRRAILHDGRWR